MDGTLIDSVWTISHLLNLLRNSLGLKALPNIDYYPWLSLGGIDLVSNALEVDVHKAKYYLNVFRSEYMKIDTSKSILYEGTFQCLEALKNSNFYLAICTNKPRNLAIKVLKETGIYHFFDYINAGGDLPNKKPDASNLISCLNFLNIKNYEAVMIGDSRLDQILAENAKTPFIFFSEGYNDGVKLNNKTLIIKKHCDVIPLIKKGIH